MTHDTQTASPTSQVRQAEGRPQQNTAEHVYVCQQCPFGCALKVQVDKQGMFVSVTGNTCERGEEYARLRTQGFNDEEIHAITGEGSQRDKSASFDKDDTTSLEAAKPEQHISYSSFRKRRHERANTTPVKEAGEAEEPI